MTTTTGFLRSLIADRRRFAPGELDTGLIERLRPLPAGRSADAEVALAAAMLISPALPRERRGDDPFARVDGWRLAAGGPPRGGGWRSAAASRSR